MATADSPHTQLQKLMNSQQWDHALNVAYQILDTQPESSWLHTTLGKIYYNLRELKHAETSLKTAIYHHQTHAQAHTYLGLVYLAMKRIGSADDCCKKAFSLDPSSLEAWTLYYHIKLAYSDILAAKDCYTRLEQLGADLEELRNLRFQLICHTKNKEPIDYKYEIALSKETILAEPQNHIAHAQLAYFYNQFTKEADLAEQHIQTALKHHPHDPQVQETSMQIQRKKNLPIKLITAPILALTRPDQIDKNEVAAVGITFTALLAFALFGSHQPWMIRAGVFGIISLLFCSYTANITFHYLHRTEIYHRLDITSHLKPPYRSIHLLPYKNRALITCTLTALSWIALGSTIYLLTH